MEIYIFFQSVPNNKSYAQISSKQGREGSKKNIENLKKKEKIDFFPIDFIFVFL